MEQILIGEEISLLKKGRGVNGEIMPGRLHLLGSYSQVALGESGGWGGGVCVQIPCPHQKDGASGAGLCHLGLGGWWL